MVFAGTMIVSGNAKAVVTATGMHTEFGRVAKLLDVENSQITPLQKQLKLLSKQLGAAVVLIAVCVIAVLLAVQGLQSPTTVMDVLLFGIALAVAATPEGLAAVITLVLAIGVQRMARRGAIVKKLPAVETLGSTTVIASDKTGTMTRNEMTVRVLVTASGQTNVSGSGYSPEGLAAWIAFASLGISSASLLGVATVFFAMVPSFGAFVVWVPIVIYLAILHHWVQAGILMAVGTLVISTLDNILYPVLVGAQLRIHTAPIFISIVGGVWLFGISGLILGPIVFALAQSLLDIWRER
jgi:hypothetical protein